ncbi:AzlC family ABC transporter permease [Pandoraea sp.]|uniref:AzlC family ABC transporter permease n=1 Tax=Pandoraea sp. TaxID=1883445 RepID=UPI0011FC82ED|nr:AzlC family ABC transporter permease [Pandoraea sp.]TAL55619.1 MAG: branched-chain amino acid ABC transporter permease [Pandoraea sp.]TAM16788.1 MAG: branched-chain amino acid ABC transporter permease [Pandoraea sp.]
MLNRLPEFERRAFLAGMRVISPTAMAVFSWGLVTGIAMSKSSLTLGQAIGMSLLVYAGSAQLATLPLFAANLPLWMILLTSAMVNLRFLIFSAGLQPHFAHLPMWRRIILGFLNGDIAFVMFMRQGYEPGPVPGKESFYYGVTLTNWLAWQVSSILGILLASAIPNSWGLEFAGTLALIPVLVHTIVNRSTALAVVVSSVLVLLAFNLPYRLSLLLAVAAAIAAGMACDEIIERARLRQINAMATSGKKLEERS